MSSPTYQSETEVLNGALLKIGEQTVSSIDGSERQAVEGKRVYAKKRDALLRRYRWNFAMERAELAADSTSPAFGYGNQFSLPSDTLHVVGIYDDNELLRNYTATKYSWKIEGNKLLTDLDSPIQIFYIKRVENVGLFDSLFGDALEWFMAIDLAYALGSSRRRSSDAVAGFNDSVAAAKKADAIEGTPELIRSSEWLDARSEVGFRGPFREGPII